MIVAGFGFRSAATVESLRDAYARAGGHADGLATLADKAETAAFRAFAEAENLPVTSVCPDALHEQTTPTNSDHSIKYRNSGSVAEAAALVAAGRGAKLIAPRVVSADRMATCALARRDRP